MAEPLSRVGGFERGRLCFRPPERQDIPFLCRLYGDPELMKHISLNGKALTPEQARAKAEGLLHDWESRGCGMFMISLSAEPEELIGYCGFKFGAALKEAELGYILDHPWWGRGLATEAARGCMDLARNELGLTRLVAVTDPVAAASQKVLSKLGFRRMPQEDKVLEGYLHVYYECILKR